MKNPFKSLGDINQMRKQAKQIQSALEGEEYEESHGGVEVRISGNQQILDVIIDGEANEDVKTAVNKAIKKSQQAAAMKLAQMSMGSGE